MVPSSTAQPHFPSLIFDEAENNSLNLSTAANQQPVLHRPQVDGVPVDDPSPVIGLPQITAWRQRPLPELRIPAGPKRFIDLPIIL